MTFFINYSSKLIFFSVTHYSNIDKIAYIKILPLLGSILDVQFFFSYALNCFIYC